MNKEQTIGGMAQLEHPEERLHLRLHMPRLVTNCHRELEPQGVLFSLQVHWL